MSLIGNPDTPASYVADYMQACVGMFGIPAGGFTSDIETYGAATNYNVESLYAAMLNSTIGRSIYAPGSSNESFATKLVDKVGGSLLSDADKAAAIDEVQALLDGGLSQAATAMAVVEFVAGLETSDETFGAVAQQFQNRIEIANYYTFSSTNPSSTLSTLTSVLSGVSNTTDVSDPADYLDTVTDPGVSTGQNFTLTTAADSIIGTTGNDTISGAVGSSTTFNVTDTISGGTGTDTFAITFDGASPAMPAATITGVEVFKIRDVGNTAALTADFNLISGETEVWNDRSTNAGGDTTFSNLATGTKVGMIGNAGATTMNKFVFGYATGTSAVNLHLADGVKQTAATGAISSASTATTMTITSTGSTATAPNTVGQIDITGDKLTSVTIDAQTALKIDGTAGNGGLLGFDSASTAATMTITGAGTANVGELDTNLDVLDASGNTGGVTATLIAAGQKVTGGSGNDTIYTLAGNTAMTQVVDAGAGTADKLIVTATTAVDTTTEGNFFKNFEVLQVQDNTSADISKISTYNTFDKIIVNQSSTNATGVTNMNATQAANITLLAAGGTGAITLDIKDASVNGQIDTLKITADDGVATTSSSFTMTAPVMTGIENLELTSNETGVTVSALTSAVGLTSVKTFGSATQTMTTGAVTFALNSVFDFSGTTGAVSFDASAATTAGLTIKGSLTAANTLKDTTLADVIVGGAKLDAITYQGGADSITLGAYGDTFSFNSISGSTKLGTAPTFKLVAADSQVKAGATGAFTAATAYDSTLTDKITGVLNPTYATNAGTKFIIDTDVAASGVTFGTSLTFGTTTVATAGDFFVLDNNANEASTVYVFQDSNGNGKIDATGDLMVMVVGSAQFTSDEFAVSSGNLVMQTT